FSERVVRNRFPAIEKKRNFVPGENPLQRLVVRPESARQHGDFAITPPGAHMAQNLASSQDCLRFRIRADRGAKAFVGQVPLISCSSRREEALILRCALSSALCPLKRSLLTSA